MGTPHEPQACRLFVAFMYAPGADVRPVLAELAARFGAPAYDYGPIPFTFSDYYSQEMGKGLVKCYFVHRVPFDRATLPALKLSTNELEDEHRVDGRRVVNIDPGYLAVDKLVLATTKDYSHRLYLGQGIYGEVTLHWQQGAMRELPWTYPDFRLAEVKALLTKARAELVGKK
jgi:hypothetical protein